MFKIKRFRKIVMKYAEIYATRPEVIKQDVDLYILDLKNLISLVNYQLENAYNFLEKICDIQSNLSTKPNNLFWSFIQSIVDYLYDNTLYSIEELDSCRSCFVTFKLRAEQIKQLSKNISWHK